MIRKPTQIQVTIAVNHNENMVNLTSYDLLTRVKKELGTYALFKNKDVTTITTDEAQIKIKTTVETEQEFRMLEQDMYTAMDNAGLNQADVLHALAIYIEKDIYVHTIITHNQYQIDEHLDVSKKQTVAKLMHMPDISHYLQSNALRLYESNDFSGGSIEDDPLFDAEDEDLY